MRFAAAVLHLAVLDLQSMFKKIMRLSSLSLNGKLRTYVYRAIQDGRKQEVTFTPDELSALRFWEDENSCRELYFDLLDIRKIPKEVRQQRDYCMENYGKIQAELMEFQEKRLNHSD